MWHVVQTIPNCDDRVCRFLSIHGLTTYAPRFPAPGGTRPGSVRARRHRWVFPGYVFFEVTEPFSSWHVIRFAPFVRRLLTEDGEPAPVAEPIVDHLRKRLQAGALSSSTPAFKAGQPVTIQAGPLAMVDAIFDRHLPANDRVSVLINLLGRPIAIAIDLANVR